MYTAFEMLRRIVNENSKAVYTYFAKWAWTFLRSLFTCTTRLAKTDSCSLLYQGNKVDLTGIYWHSNTSQNGDKAENNGDNGVTSQRENLGHGDNYYFLA